MINAHIRTKSSSKSRPKKKDDQARHEKKHAEDQQAKSGWQRNKTLEAWKKKNSKIRQASQDLQDSQIQNDQEQCQTVCQKCEQRSGLGSRLFSGWQQKAKEKRQAIATLPAKKKLLLIVVFWLAISLFVFIFGDTAEAASRDEDGNVTEISRLEATAFICAWNAGLFLIYLIIRGGGSGR